VKIFNIIHQQIAQLKWHILACFGLVMVLPLEEAIVNFNDGDGFYSDRMIIVSVLISILLAGLIACSNVQADFKEKRYSFWRSKPINAKLFIILKYFTGLFVAMFIMLSPVVFYRVCIAVGDIEPLEALGKIFVGIAAIVAVMTYTFCFACNILVRKTARSWLIGLTLTCLTLLLPFILPFNYRLAEDGHGGFLWDMLLVLAIALTLGTFIFAILAAERNWHLKTNLKGLLWVAAVLLFSLMLLFSTQIANIKVLDEKEVPYQGNNSLSIVDGRIFSNKSGFIDISNNQISLPVVDDLNYKTTKLSLEDMGVSEFKKVASNEKYKQASLLRRVYYMFQGQLYSLEIKAYYKQLEGSVQDYKNAFLIRRKYSDGQSDIFSVLDLSDISLFNQGGHTGMYETVMRRFGDRLVVLANGMITADLSSPDELVLLDKNNSIKHGILHLMLDNKERRIPLEPIDGISMNERIRFSIDMSLVRNERFFDYSCVDIKDGKTIFGLFKNGIVYRCEVTRWDEDWIYYKTTAERDLTLLESAARNDRCTTFMLVADGRLYVYNISQLLVFDIRSRNRIHKLGHFIRTQSSIRDIEVLDDGNILMAIWFELSRDGKGNSVVRTTLSLLKKP
jgi:hypothetical protein